MFDPRALGPHPLALAVALGRRELLLLGQRRHRRLEARLGLRQVVGSLLGPHQLRLEPHLLRDLADALPLDGRLVVRSIMGTPTMGGHGGGGAGDGGGGGGLGGGQGAGGGDVSPLAGGGARPSD